MMFFWGIVAGVGIFLTFKGFEFLFRIIEQRQLRQRSEIESEAFEAWRKFENYTNSATTARTPSAAELLEIIQRTRARVAELDKKYGPTPDAFVMLESTFAELKRSEYLERTIPDGVPGLFDIPIHTAPTKRTRAGLAARLRAQGLIVQEVCESGELKP